MSTQLALRARKGTHAMLATRVLSVGVAAVSITVLSRLIPPAEFGVWAVAVLALGLATIVRELGLVASIAHAQELPRETLERYFWLSVCVSCAAACALALAAPLLAWLYGAPRVQPVVWAGCASLVLGGLGLVHAARLRRELQYGKVALIEGGGLLAGLAVSLAAAWLWRDVRALVAGHIAGAAWIAASALILGGWLPRAAGGARAKLNLAFSLQVTWYNLATYAGNNVGVAAGFRFGAVDLGLFNRAQQVYNLAHFAFLTPIAEVGFSLLCRLRQERAYIEAYVLLARRVWVLFLPYAAVLPLVSEDLVRALLGPAWAGAAPVLAWFAPAVLAQAFASLFAQLMASQGRGAELRAWAAADLALRAGGAALGARYGIAGVAAGFALASLLTVPLMAWIAGRRGPVKLRHQLDALWPGLLLAAAAALGATAALAAEVDAGWHRLALVGLSAAACWAVVCALLRPARDALLGKVAPA